MAVDLDPRYTDGRLEVGGRAVQHDQQLLFGVLAVQLTEVTPADLLEVSAGWLADPSRSLAERLIAAGKLDDADRDLIESVAARALRAHGDDPQASLRALGGTRAVHESFAGSLGFDADGSLLPSIGGEAAATEEGAAEIGELEDSAKITVEHPGRYTIKGEGGQGGIGRVLIAFDEHVGREVAIKELLADSGHGGSRRDGSERTPATTSPLLARFLREARITGQLEHPSIVPVYEVGRRSDGRLYYTMKLVRGRTLAEALAGCGSSTDRLRLLGHFADLCQAVAYAHSRGVIHRDIKPDNVMVGEFGETVLLDWGLAKVRGKADIRSREIEREIELLREVETGRTVDGKAIGTPAYMSPEQADGDVAEMDSPSDVWSLGAVLYEILAGRPPFSGATPFEIMGKVLTESPAELRSICPEAPPELAAVAHKALERDKARRYPDAAELAREIEAFQSGARVGAHDYSSWELLARFVARHRAAVGVSSMALALLMALGVTAYWSVAQERDRAVAAERRAVAARQQAGLNLAEAFSEKATRAFEDGQRVAPEIFAAAALSEAERADARGMVISLANLPAPQLIWQGTVGEQCTGSCLHPDTRTVACGGPDGDLLVWRLADPEPRRFAGHRGQVLDAAFSPDGTLVAAGGIDAKVLVWDVQTGALRHTLEGHDNWTFRLVFSPAGDLLASAGWDGRLNLWDVETGELRAPLRGESKRLWTPHFSPDGRRVAACGGQGKAYVWDVASSARLHTLPDQTSAVLGCAFSPDGKLLATGGDDRIVRLWDLERGKTIREIKDHPTWLTSVTFTPDGSRVVSRNNTGQILVHDVATGARLAQRFGGNVFFDSEGRAFTSSKVGAIGRVIDLNLDASPPTYVAEAGVTYGWFAADDRSVFVFRNDHRVGRWLPETGELRPILPPQR